MRRRIAYGTAAVLAALLLIAGGWGAAWLFGTAEGARWVIEAVSRHTPLTLTARRVEGRLADRLRLEGVSLTLKPPAGAAEIESLELNWRPLRLFVGRVAIRELTLTGVVLRDDSPAQAPNLAWPKVSGPAGIFSAHIDLLRLDRLTFHRLAEPPVHIHRLSAALDWRAGFFSAEKLTVESDTGRLAGRFAVGLEHPSLQLDLEAIPAEPLAGMDTFALQGRFSPGREGEQVAGEFTLSGATGSRKRLELAGEGGMNRETFRLRKLRLTSPERRGSVTGEGEITPSAAGPRLAFTLEGAGLDLTPELGAPAELSGTLTLTGTPEDYRGRFSLASRGRSWRGADLAGDLAGDTGGVRLAPLTGSLLAGTLAGELTVRWSEGLVLAGELRGRDLDPAWIAPDWEGIVNLDVQGRAVLAGDGEPRGDLSVRLRQSRLHGQALTGELAAAFAGGDLRIGRLDLKGKGFDLQAAGELAQRLKIVAQVEDLSHLVPGTAGALRVDGWARWREGRPSGALHGRGSTLAGFGFRTAEASLTLRLDEGQEQPLEAALTLRKASYGGLAVDSLRLTAAGTARRHTLRTVLSGGGVEAWIDLTGAYDRKSWQGAIVRFDGRNGGGPWRLAAPAPLTLGAGGIALAPLVLTGRGAESLEVAADLTREPLAGSLRVEIRDVDLARAGVWLPEGLRLEGFLAGRVRATLAAGEPLAVAGEASLAGGNVSWQKGREALAADLQTVRWSWDWRGGLDGPDGAAERLVAAARITAAGVATLEGNEVAIPRLALNLDGNGQGWRGVLDLSIAGGGSLRGSFASPGPARLAVPETGEMAAEGAGIDLALLRPWLPSTVGLEGRLAASAKGSLLPGRRVAAEGEASLGAGRVSWRDSDGEIGADLHSTSLVWEWREEVLSGDLTLALAEHGRLQGHFRLPIPARFPVSVQAQGELQGSLKAQVREEGLLTAFLPGWLQESRGEIDADLQLAGSWEDPRFAGRLRLTGAGAYLPAAGIRLKDIQLTLNLERNLVVVEAFRAVSGSGHLTGEARIRLAGWRVAGYEGRIDGERFQIVFLPELQILATPKLTFSGTPEKLTVRGEVNLPELLIFGPPTGEVVQPSRDVILEGVAQPNAKAFPLLLDVQVRVILGERVLAKVGGIDAQLTGAVDLQFQNPERITSRGEIRVVRGRYKTYGVDLAIVRGRLFYAGGPLQQPTLDILALRTAGNVRAGVLVGGTMAAPTVRLYSEPAMPDVDILAYIVFGRPLGGGEQTSLMVQAAGMLLSRGQSVVLQEQIKNRLGLSTLEIQTSGGDPLPGSPEYVGARTTPADVAPGRTAASLTDTVLTVGKYLTPQLYFSYGRSLFTGGNLFRLRYDLTPQWQIETQTGSASGVDLYYKIEFQ